VLARQQAAAVAEHEANFVARLTAMQNELKDSDSALAETRDRLIALQLEHPARETAPTANVAALEAEVAQLKRALAAATAVPPVAAPGPDDLTRIKGIGKVIERRLHELGITSFRQLAALSTADTRRVNEALEFPGRVERERWVEQARSLAGA
jgi:large subunit ribosomal protein L21